ncbi:MAG TPA: class E sortase [Patescibacteria group bacterium]|nr:class E sortase [Patescibacteria group bacterium]
MTSKIYYTKRNTFALRQKMRFLGLTLFIIGIGGLIYIFFPLLSWQLYLAPNFVSSNLASPIPKAAIITSTSLQSLLKNSTDIFHPVDYSNAANWYPNFTGVNQTSSHQTFYLSIPKLGISNATVTNADNDLDKHLVNYSGTAFPPAKGNAVIFGHSTLPQWFDPHNYKAIFATVHTLEIGDKLIVNENGAAYTYTIDNIYIVDADDVSPLEQQYDTSYLTLITCTPPGTTWKRLIIHSRLQNL